MKSLSVILICLFLFTSCAPELLKPYEPPELKFEETPTYSIQEDLNKIEKPKPIKRMYAKKLGDDSLQILPNAEGADFVVIAPTEYAKVGAVVKLAKTYKEIVLDQEALVNTYIDQINALKELVALEQKKSQMYRELWITSENAYRQEAYEHKWDNRINKAGMYTVTVGSIILFLLFL
jgi:hypothetical protein